jgi:hypothetical protein
MQGHENMLLLLWQSIATNNHNACYNDYTTRCDNDDEDDDNAHYNHDYTDGDDNCSHHNDHTAFGHK